MVSLENLLLYIPLAALLVMLPGPDFALIVRTSLTEGRSSGQAAACGVALGIMVHTSAAMLGISAVIAQSVTLFTLLRYAGAAYLFWMGIHALRAGREVTAAVVRHGGVMSAAGKKEPLFGGVSSCTASLRAASTTDTATR